MPIINKNYKKFVGYNSEEFKYSLQEVIEKYFEYQVEHTRKHTKPEAVVSSLSYYGLDTLPNFGELLNKSGLQT